MNFSTAAFVAAGLLLCTNPLVVWLVASGCWRSVELIFYFLLTRTLGGLMRYGDVRSIVTTAFCMAVALIADARLLYVILALVPLLALLAPPHMIRKSPASFFLVILFPAATLLGGYLYADAVFKGIPFGVAQMTGVGVWAFADSVHFPWAYEYGGKFLRPALLFLAASLMVFPLAFVAPFALSGERLAAVPLLVAAIAPVIAAIVALKAPFYDYPASLLVLLAAPAANAAMGMIARRRAWIALVFLALGWLGGAALFHVTLGDRL